MKNPQGRRQLASGDKRCIMRPMSLRSLIYTALFVLSACNVTRADPLPQWPTASTVRVVQGTPVPTVARQLHDVPTPVIPPTATASAIDCRPQAAEQEKTHHTVIATVNYTEHRVSVQQHIQYPNRTGVALTSVALNVEANLWPDTFLLNGVSLGGDKAQPPSYELTGRRLTVTLPETLRPDCILNLELALHLTIPPIGEGIEAYRGYLGYSPRQFNLGHWLPTMAVFMDGEWITREAIAIGEQTVLDAADWDVTLHLVDAPDTLRIAAPGTASEGEDGSWHFTLANARDFSLSMSEEFRVTSRIADNGVTVELYSFGDALVDHEGETVDGATFALGVAARSLGVYADLYGQYPYSRMVVVEGDFPDGMEFSGMVFVSGDWFRTFTGSPASYLMMITAHETAHQWWYARVGNDAALDPWLDEALATYSEFAFIEEYYPELRDWWWEFRVNRLTPEGFVDSAVYEFSSIRQYINAVYLRGVLMLHALREDLGSEAFYDWLRRYVQAGDGQVATPHLFWSLLNEEQLEHTRHTRQTYLRHPNS